MKNNLSLIRTIIGVLAFFLFIPVLSGAEDAKPKAADLVEDGQPIDLSSVRYRAVFKELRLRYHFSPEDLEKWFGGVAVRKRVLELMDTQWEARPYYEYYPRFITDDVLKEGRRMLEKHKDLFDAIEKAVGVERKIIVAIWGIETRYGKYDGAFNLFSTLNTMFDAYPRRREFYRRQLIEFLLLCRENGVDPLSVTGSYGGAFGQTQFIPSSFREYAVDFDGDGRRDVWNSVPDILASIGNYLRKFDWVFGAPIYHEIGDSLKSEQLAQAFRKGRQGLVPWKTVRQDQQIQLPPSPGDRDVTIVGLELPDGGMRYVAGYINFQAITKWNNSNRYAMAVTELAEQY